jgi:adenylate cyclase
MTATRRLAAIMFTDMVGFTASAQTDEARALRSLREQEKLVRPLLKTHKGREIKTTGDGFLVEFESALRAVQCAIDIHQHLEERNSRSRSTPIQLRIGVHLGDVEERGGDIFGDSVNLAARIEPLAEPGGICISEPVFVQIRNKIPNQLEKMEPKELKNVRFPMEVYRVVLPWTVREPPSTSSGPTGLAVLPFVNISPDPKDEYFADGLTEELITVLSQLRGFRVIARTSVMPYKSTSKGVSQIGAELRVSSVLEGSVRKVGSRLRVTAQLIDVGSEDHVWANTYDRELNDVFAVQSELAKEVAEALRIELRASEAARLKARPTVRPDSYLAYLKGRTLFHHRSKAALEAAKEQFELAISLDSENAAAYSGLADVTRVSGWSSWGIPRAEWEETTRRLVARAIELDPNLAEAHTSLGLILWEDFEYVAAEKEYKLALSLNPSYALAHFWYAHLLEDEARTDEALIEFALAERTDPLSSDNLLSLALLLRWLGRFDEALDRIRRVGELRPDSQEYHGSLCGYYLARSESEPALREAKRIEELETDPLAKPMARAYCAVLSGEKEKARTFLRHEETLPEFPNQANSVAWRYALLGDLDDCFRCLDVAVKTRNIALQGFRLDPMVEHVRRDPRFQTVLKEMNLA